MEKKIEIERYIKRCVNILNLQGWNFNIKFEDCDQEDCNGNKSLAQIEVLNQYLECLVIIYDQFFKQTKEQRFKTILHEMIHIYTNPFLDVYHNCMNGKFTTPHDFEKINEECVSKLQQIIYTLYKK